jgi:hypothetical protein
MLMAWLKPYMFKKNGIKIEMRVNSLIDLLGRRLQIMAIREFVMLNLRLFVLPQFHMMIVSAHGIRYKTIYNEYGIILIRPLI